MTRKRLRPLPPIDELAKLYAIPHDHRRWSDHHLRVDVTIQVARWMADGALRSSADLSCGNGTILRSIPSANRIFGDFAPGYNLCGPIEQTLEKIPRVDMFVCSETLEHLDDPDQVLKGIRARSAMLILSTPLSCWDDDNPEHLWAWSRDDVQLMLEAAGFTTVVFASVDFTPVLPYNFGIFGCK